MLRWIVPAMPAALGLVSLPALGAEAHTLAILVSACVVPSLVFFG